MPIVTVDGKQIEVQSGMTVMQACELAGAEIPRFCYHERLEIAGNCRMCLVKVEKMPKPVASCAHPVADGMVIHTSTDEVKKMREGVMEFLLINHPLDCPICDQGGECDLQDQAMAYGMDKSRYLETKRAVDDKYMGPLVKTHMTRCIHCTRCVRFIEDVAGTNELGAVNRGEDMEITTFVEKAISSELSGNIIDLCPVGALTSKPYAFKARPWELSHTESIDVLDAVGANIRIDYKGTEVMRIMPRLNEEVNEEWLADKGRFACDGLKYQRLDAPMIKKHGKLEIVSWEEALAAVVAKLNGCNPSKIGAIAGDLTDVETMQVTKDLFTKLGSPNIDGRQDGSKLGNVNRADYIFNTTIAGVEEADMILIIGSNPRHEAPLLASRIRKAQQRNNAKIFVIGEKADLALNYKHLGHNPWLLKQIADGQHPMVESLKGFKKPLMIIGSGAMARDDYEATLYHAKRIAQRFGFVNENWNGFNILQRAASRVGCLDIGFIPGKNGLSTNEMLSSKMDLLFLLGADELDFAKLNSDTSIIYIGHHGDKGAQIADIILPAPAYTEKDATYVNIEGRVQHTLMAVPPLGEAVNDWKILLQIAIMTGNDLPYRTLSELRQQMTKTNSIFKSYGVVKREHIELDHGKMKDFSDDVFTNPIKNYYLTDSIARSSPTMAKCAKELAA